MTGTETLLLDKSKIYSQEGLLDVINGLPIAIAVIDEDMNLALANKMIHSLVNKNKSQLVGHVSGDALGCIHHDDTPQGCGFGPECLRCRLRETVKATMKKNRAHCMVQTDMVLKSQGKRHLRITTQPLILKGDKVVLLSIEDVTEARKHELMKLEKEKLSAVLYTAGAVCHEMNQPLMVILGYAELLLDEIPEESSQESSLMEIKKQADRLGMITRKLMSITQYKTKGYLNSEILDIDAASRNLNPETESDKE